MKKLKEMIFVDGYNPFNGFNIILSVVSGVVWGVVFYLVIGEGLPLTALFNGSDAKYLIAGLVSFLLLLFRNRKLKSVPKMIIFSVLSSVLGIAVAVVGFALLILFGIFSGFGGETSSSGNVTKWKKQFSQSKGEYSTDGQGNFKDQHGNDVYNPQGVSDYDKL